MLKQVVILVGGRGTRLGDLTKATPKPMLSLGDRPFLDFLISNFARFGVSEILLLAGYCGEKIEEHYRENPIDGVNIKVLIEPEPLDTAGCLKFAENHLHDVFMVSNGDSFFDFNLLSLLEFSESDNWLGRLALRKVNEPGRFGRVELDKHGFVKVFAEKISKSSDTTLINGGIYLFRKEILNHIGDGSVSMEKEIFPKLVESGLLQGKEAPGYFIDIGIPESLERAGRELAGVQTRPAVFFDRDGTLNFDEGYTHKLEDLTWINGAIDTIRLCNDRGYYVFVVSNQAGVARGYYGEAEVIRFHDYMQKCLQKFGAHIDDFTFCPHHVEGVVSPYDVDCTCRKPKTGLLDDLKLKWPIDLDHSIFIGDSESDMQAARNFGIRGIKFMGGNLFHLLEKEL